MRQNFQTLVFEDFELLETWRQSSELKTENEFNKFDDYFQMFKSLISTQKHCSYKVLPIDYYIFMDNNKHTLIDRYILGFCCCYFIE